MLEVGDTMTLILETTEGDLQQWRWNMEVVFHDAYAQATEHECSLERLVV